MISKLIFQVKLSSECWNIQIWGISACTECDLNGTDECGGPEIQKSGKNSLGFTVPIDESK